MKLSKSKQKQAVLLHLMCQAGQKIFDTLSDTEDGFDSVIASLGSYFIANKNLI